MEANDSGLDFVIVTVVLAEAFGKQFLPPVGILGLGGISVTFPERCYLGFQLPVFGVNTGRRGVQIPLHSVEPRRFQGVEVDQSVVVKNFGMVILDESHSAHVRRERIDRSDPAGHLQTVIPPAQVDDLELIGIHIRVFRIFEIGATDVVPLLPEIGHEMMTDKSPGTRNQYRFSR